MISFDDPPRHWGDDVVDEREDEARACKKSQKVGVLRRAKQFAKDCPLLAIIAAVLMVLLVVGVAQKIAHPPAPRPKWALE